MGSLGSVLSLVAVGMLLAAVAGSAIALRHRMGVVRLGRRLAAHRSTPEPRGAPWWERATERLAPVATAIEGAAARILQRAPRLASLGTSAEEARVGVGPTEIVASGMVVGGAVAAGTLALGVPPAAAAAFGLLGTAVPSVAVTVVAARRRAAFAAALPDVLLLLAGTLRAGVPLTGALEAVATEAGGPVAPELRRVAGETALGRPLPEALAAVGRRMRSDEVAWVGMAVEIHQEAGGNLAEVLDTVARTIQQRQRLRREVAALTAEGRISAVVLGVLPVGLAAVIAVVNPGYLSPLVRTSTGTTLLVAAGVGMVVGFVWMRRIVEVEV